MFKVGFGKIFILIVSQKKETFSVLIDLMQFSIVV